MAAVSVTFSRYFLEITHAPISEGLIAAAALTLLTIVNCFGVRAGSSVQSALMILKIVAIAASSSLDSYSSNPPRTPPLCSIGRSPSAC